MSNCGRLIVISAPSGGGKNAVIKEVIKRRSDIVYNVSTTTRSRRKYEEEGVHYYFVTREEFQQKLDSDQLIEWAEVHGELYGTEREPIEQRLKNAQTVMLDLDFQGGEAVQRMYPDDTIAIFLHAPSMEVLRSRLAGRGSEDEKAIDRRLERYPMEKEKGDKYPFQVVNDDFETTILKVLKIIDSNKEEPIRMIEKVEEEIIIPDDDIQAGSTEKESVVILDSDMEMIETADLVDIVKPIRRIKRTLAEPDLVDDFKDVSSNVYEAVMIASKRARQVGQQQKEEIDAWNRSLESTMIEDEMSEEEPSYAEKKEFNFPKPIVQALSELKGGGLDFHYQEKKQ